MKNRLLSDKLNRLFKGFMLVGFAALLLPINVNAADKNFNGDITISLAGDCSIGSLSIHSYDNSFDQMYDLEGPEYFFGGVKDVFLNDDMTLVNFEGVLTTSTELVEKQYNIKGKPEYINVINGSGIDAVSFGNNHRIDYGEQGITDTINAFKSISLPYAYDTNVGIYKTKQGVRVGYVSVNEVYDKTLVEDFLQKGIADLRAQNVDLILACCHWGDEGTHKVNSYQKELGHKCVDWGADLVIGCHPHVLQGIEKYNDDYIIYSLGNFCFGGNKNPKNKDSMIVQCRFNFKDGKYTKNQSMNVIPCSISSVTSRNDYRPTVLTGKKAKSLLTKMNSYCSGFNTSVSMDGSVITK